MFWALMQVLSIKNDFLTDDSPYIFFGGLSFSNQYQTKTMAAAAIKKFLHTFHFTPSTCSNPSPTRTFPLSSIWVFQLFFLQHAEPFPLHSNLQFELRNGGKQLGHYSSLVKPLQLLLRNPLSGSTLLARLATLQPACINMYPSFSIDSCCGETGAVTKHLLETISVRIIWFCWRPCKAETAELQVAASAGNAWPAHHLQCTCRATSYHNIPYHTKSYHTMPYRRALY